MKVSLFSVGGLAMIFLGSTSVFAHPVAAQGQGCELAFRGWGLVSGAGIPQAGEASRLAAGRQFLVALRADGSLQSFGAISTAPAGQFVQVAGGFGHAAAITASGSVVAWGYNDKGQTDVPESLPIAVQVTTTYNNTAIIDIHGQIRVWGWSAEGLTTPPPGSFLQVDGGEFHFVARRTNGQAVCWGFNDSGQCDVPVGVDNCVDVAAGGGVVGSVATGHTVVLTSGGVIRCWGNNGWGQCDVPSTTLMARKVAAGGLFSLALMQDGSVIGWGRNSAGQTTVPVGLANVEALVAGEESSFAVIGPTCCVGDLFRDGQVNGADLGILLSQWGPATPATVSDLNGDGVVDGSDLGMLLASWGPCP